MYANVIYSKLQEVFDHAEMPEMTGTFLDDLLLLKPIIKEAVESILPEVYVEIRKPDKSCLAYQINITYDDIWMPMALDLNLIDLIYKISPREFLTRISVMLSSRLMSLTNLLEQEQRRPETRKMPEVLRLQVGTRRSQIDKWTIPTDKLHCLEVASADQVEKRYRKYGPGNYTISFVGTGAYNTLETVSMYFNSGLEALQYACALKLNLEKDKEAFLQEYGDQDPEELLRGDERFRIILKVSDGQEVLFDIRNANLQ